jgi:alpha-D-ribose 1-methylphosphonate 5-triphosphate synthase subunit PhnH
MSCAAGAVLLTLVDQSMRLYLAPSHNTPEIRHWIAFHCGAPLTEADAADFALGSWEALQPVARFAIGTPDYPDRSATLIVECDALAPANARLTGPGIETETLAHLPETSAFAANHAGFPLGFDCLFTARDQVLGLPRSTKVEAI